MKGGIDYWLAQSEILLFGLLFIAARTDQDMARVCEWVMVQDRPRERRLHDNRGCRTAWISSAHAALVGQPGTAVDLLSRVLKGSGDDDLPQAAP